MWLLWGILITVQIILMGFGIFVCGREWNHIEDESLSERVFYMSMMFSGLWIWIIGLSEAYIAVRKFMRRKRVARLKDHETGKMIAALYALDLIDRDTYNKTDEAIYDYTHLF